MKIFGNFKFTRTIVQNDGTIFIHISTNFYRRQANGKRVMSDFNDSVPLGFAQYVGDALDWMTASEIAALKPPDMPTSEWGVLKRAKRENRRGRPRCAQGGGGEYSVGDWPDECAMLIAYGRRHAPTHAGDMHSECGAARIRILDAVNEGGPEQNRLQEGAPAVRGAIGDTQAAASSRSRRAACDADGG